jgi:hypothetical protein
MNWPVAIALTLLPLVAGLQSFAVSYGYKGKDRAVARINALRLIALLYVIEVAAVLLFGF